MGSKMHYRFGLDESETIPNDEHLSSPIKFETYTSQRIKHKIKFRSE